jgi:hypothetical protein
MVSRPRAGRARRLVDVVGGACDASLRHFDGVRVFRDVLAEKLSWLPGIEANRASKCLRPLIQPCLGGAN